MPGFLLDPFLFKHLAPGASRKPSLRDWISVAEEPIFLSAVSIGETAARIQKLGKTSRAMALRDWLQDLVAHGGESILPVRVEVAWLAGVLLHRFPEASKAQFSSALLAATAKVYELTLVTIRDADFKFMKPDINILDPFQQASGKSGAVEISPSNH